MTFSDSDAVNAERLQLLLIEGNVSLGKIRQQQNNLNQARNGYYYSLKECFMFFVFLSFTVSSSETLNIERSDLTVIKVSPAAALFSIILLQILLLCSQISRLNMSQSYPISPSRDVASITHDNMLPVTQTYPRLHSGRLRRPVRRLQLLLLGPWRSAGRPRGTRSTSGVGWVRCVSIEEEVCLVRESEARATG